MILLLYKHPNFPAHLYSILLSLIRRGTFSGVVKQSHISYIVIVVPGYKKQQEKYYFSLRPWGTIPMVSLLLLTGLQVVPEISFPQLGP